MNKQFFSKIFQVNFQLLTRSSFIEVKNHAAFKPVLLTINRNICSKYFSNKKTLKPSVIPVTKGNSHLEIKLFDENNVEIGVMNMGKAQRTAKDRELKLVLVDEEQKPPKFRLMKGSELAAEQLKKRAEKKVLKEKPHELNEKEIQWNLKTGDNDLSYKFKHIEEYYEKGHSIRMPIKSNLSNDEQGNVDSLQNEMINKIKTNLKSIPNIIVKKRDAKMLLINIPSRLHEKDASKK